LLKVDGGKTDTLTLHLRATVKEKIKPEITDSGYVIRQNFSGASVSTTEADKSVFVNVSAL